MLREELPIANAVYYNDKGEVTEEFKTALVYTTARSFYIRELKATLYVKGSIVKREDKARYKWRKVGENSFKYYIKYLKTNQEYCYNLANRHRDE